MYSKETLESIINAVADPIFVKDRKHCWVLLNDACCKFIGHTREELIGKSDYDFFPKKEADVFWEKDEAVFRTGRENLNEENFTDANRIVHTIVTKKNLFVDSNKNQFIVGVIRDITEQKISNETVIKQTAELARSEAEREHLEFFAYVAAHDLREPLQRIVGFAELLKSASKQDLTEDGKKYLQKIQEGAGRMSQLIDDLLRFSKVIKRAELFHPVALNAVVARVMEDLELLIRQSDARIKVDPLPAVQGDESQLHQLFQNLISNAIKFKKADQPPSILIEIRQAGNAFWEITVSDQGIGFDPKFSEKIFRPFERLHSREQYDGSGVGLAICQKIVAYHGGKISVQTHPDQGSTFSILFPRH